MNASPFAALDQLALRGLGLRGFAARPLATPHGQVFALDAAGRGPLPPVVLLHGLGSRATDCAPLLLRLLPRHRRVLALDLPGHGRSEVPAGASLSEGAVGALAAALGQLVEVPVLLVGNSLGGLLAARFAARHPGRVRALLLLAPAGGPMDAPTFDALLSPFRGDGPADARAFLRRAFGGSAPVAALLAPAFRHRARAPALRALVAAMGPGDLLQPSEIAALPRATRVLWAGEERVLPAAHRDYWAAHLPAGASLVDLPGACHAAIQRQPGRVARSVMEFHRGL